MEEYFPLCFLGTYSATIALITGAGALINALLKT